jgi:hypothetical protein
MRLTPTVAAALLLASAPALAQSDPNGALGTAVQEQIGADDDAQASQKRIDQIDDETQRLLSEYRRALADADSYRAYADQLAVQIGSQEEEMVEMQRQLVEVETTAREVTPLMQRMLDTLDQFVALDVPFLLEERRHRVETLREMMTRADVSMSEKYRRILEAYQVEMDYGRTIEAYEGKLGDGADARTVQFLRVGRVTLLYQTLDGRETGFWNDQKKGWTINDDYRHAFKEGLAVAKKARAPELLLVPVAAPVGAKS